MNELLKKLQDIEQRIGCLIHIKNTENWGNLSVFKKDCEDLKAEFYEVDKQEFTR